MKFPSLTAMGMAAMVSVAALDDTYGENGDSADDEAETDS